MKTGVLAFRRLLYVPVDLGRYLRLPLGFQIALGNFIVRVDRPLRAFVLRGAV